MHLLVFLMSWSWSTISPGRASRGSCQSFTWVETGYFCPRRKCLALPGPCAVTPARMPQARPCRPMRSGRQGERRRCRHAWPHTPPSRLAGGLGLPGSVGALGALCQALGPALRLSVEVCRGEASVLAAWRPVLSVGLGCLDDDPGGLQNMKNKRGRA